MTKKVNYENGKQTERRVVELLESRTGLTASSYCTWVEGSSDDCLVLDAPYTTTYFLPGKHEILLRFKNRVWVFEIKHQDTGGTADEKLEHAARNVSKHAHCRRAGAVLMLSGKWFNDKVWKRKQDGVVKKTKGDIKRMEGIAQWVEEINNTRSDLVVLKWRDILGWVQDNLH